MSAMKKYGKLGVTFTNFCRNVKNWPDTSKTYTFSDRKVKVVAFKEAIKKWTMDLKSGTDKDLVPLEKFDRLHSFCDEILEEYNRSLGGRLLNQLNRMANDIDAPDMETPTKYTGNPEKHRLPLKWNLQDLQIWNVPEKSLDFAKYQFENLENPLSTNEVFNWLSKNDKLDEHAKVRYNAKYSNAVLSELAMLELKSQSIQKNPYPAKAQSAHDSLNLSGSARGNAPNALSQGIPASVLANGPLELDDAQVGNVRVLGNVHTPGVLNGLLHQNNIIAMFYVALFVGVAAFVYWARNGFKKGSAAATADQLQGKKSNQQSHPPQPLCETAEAEGEAEGYLPPGGCLVAV